MKKKSVNFILYYLVQTIFTRYYSLLICNSIFSFYTTLNRIHRAGFAASSAADAFRAVGFFHRVDLHLAGFCTFSTLDALVMVYSVAEYGYGVEDRVESSQRADVFAEWAVYDNGKNNCDNQNGILPYVKPSHCAAHGFVQQYQRESAFQCSGRTDQFAEIRCPLSHDIYNEHRKQNNKYEKNHIFQFAEQFITFKCADFLRKRNLVQQVLDQSEWT